MSNMLLRPSRNYQASAEDTQKKKRTESEFFVSKPFSQRHATTKRMMQLNSQILPFDGQLDLKNRGGRRFACLTAEAACTQQHRAGSTRASKLQTRRRLLPSERRVAAAQRRILPSCPARGTAEACSSPTTRTRPAPASLPCTREQKSCAECQGGAVFRAEQNRSRCREHKQ